LGGSLEQEGKHSVPVAIRRGGWWGVAFVITLSVAGAMVTLPTATQTGQQISAFYAAHATVILVQQVIGVVAIGLFLAFALALGARRRRRLLIATLLLAVAELATNIPPAILSLLKLGPDGAHALTVIEDLADAALFLTIAVFSVAATSDQVRWLRAAGLAVAALSALRAVLTPLDVHALDALAPIAFVVLMLILSVRLLLGVNTQMSPGAA
jgi:hypothetical protein